MRQRFAVPQSPALLQRSLDIRVGVKHALAAEQSHGIEKVPARTDGRVDLEPVLHAGVEVVSPVARRRVHRAGAGFERDVAAKNAERIAVVQRVTETQPLELGPGHARDRRSKRSTHRLFYPRRERLRHDDGMVGSVRGLDIVRAVLKVRMKRDRQV
jgi:hypothetical protein